MIRFIALLGLVVPAAASAQPDFTRGAVVFGLQYGPGLWALDRRHLASQVGDGHAGVFVGDARNSHTASMRLGYNILGHATVEADLTATGWNLADQTRGGGGFLAGVAHWHPLALVWKDQPRPYPIDATAFLGLGYGIAGQNRGMDGQLWEVGATGSYYFSPSVAVGLFARGILLQWSNFYLDYDGRTLAGNTLALPKGSGGAFWTLGLSLDFRFET